MKLDLRGAYNLIRIKEGKEQKTTFKTRYKDYKYLVILFRLTNILITCQVFINNIVQAQLDRLVIAYLDDILIYSKNKEEYITYIQDVLLYLLQAGLLLKLEKYEFYKELVEFLGFIVSTTGI